LNDVSDVIHPNDYFDHIYCLNLERRIERWLSVHAQFKRWGIKAERFLGVDGQRQDISARYRHLLGKSIRFDQRLNRYPIESPGAFGCLLSYVKLLQDARSRGYRRILILEDDACLHKNFLNEFQNIVSLPEDWKLAYLGNSQYRWSGIREFNSSFYYARDSQGTFAVGIHGSLYDELLGLCEQQEEPIDRYLAKIQEKYQKQCFVFQPNIVIADVTQSDIRKPRHQQTHAIRMRWDIHLYHMPPTPRSMVTAVATLSHDDIRFEKRGSNVLHLNGVSTGLPPCGHRMMRDNCEHEFQCSHPRVRSPEDGVSHIVCLTCRFNGVAKGDLRADQDLITSG